MSVPPPKLFKLQVPSHCTPPDNDFLCRLLLDLELPVEAVDDALLLRCILVGSTSRIPARCANKDSTSSLISAYCQVQGTRSSLSMMETIPVRLPELEEESTGEDEGEPTMGSPFVTNTR